MNNDNREKIINAMNKDNDVLYINRKIADTSKPILTTVTVKSAIKVYQMMKESEELKKLNS